MVNPRKEISREDVLRWLMGQAQGRSLIKLLVQSSGAMAEVFDKSNSVMSYNAGRRAVVVELLQSIREVDPASYNQFIGELL